MLKSLELFGFKSFADRTLFEFSKGITCVVGPNGSGKSNVVDALKWILGDQSAKSLRGKEMSDVIFNGSSGRRSSGFAEATLTFDNSTGLLPVDTREVQIGRRLYQSGDSEYLLNQAAVRLKDIRDVFMGTGAGTAAYSIIEQGRVDQILQANPTTRRVVFEEAAGISKFKSRRIDAERRLERVAQNLLRLTDIVDEVETQLNSTRSQASKAVRYRELNEELKALWTGLAADDFRLISSKIDDEQARLDELEEELQECRDSFGELEQQKSSIETAISDCDSQLIQHERRIATYREEITRSRSVIDHQTSRLAEIAADLKKLRKRSTLSLLRAQTIENEHRATVLRVDQFEDQFVEEREALVQREELLEQLSETQKTARQRINEIQNALKQFDSRRTNNLEKLAGLEAQKAEVSKSQEQLQRRQEQADAGVEASTRRKEVLEQELHEAEETLQAQRENVASVQQERENRVQQRQLTEETLLELRQRVSADRARFSVLEELEQRQAGIAIGVQEILDRAVAAHYPPWNQVLGVVRDLLEVPLELGPIIDAALGERSQWIAVSNLTPMLDYLKRGAVPIDGRIGFVAVQTSDRTNSSPLDGDDGVELTGEDGVYGRADRLVAAHARTPGLAESLLSKTWIVESLADAQRLAANTPSDLRFVTLQGEVLTPQNELLVGHIPHESSIVSRKSELRELRSGILQSERRIEDLTERKKLLEIAIQEKHAELVSARSQLEKFSSHVAEAATKLESERQEFDRRQKAADEIRSTIESLSQRLSQIDGESHELQRDSEECTQEIETSQSEIQSIKDQLADQEQEFQKAKKELETYQLRLAKAEERRSSLISERDRSERDLSQVRVAVVEFAEQVRELETAQARGEMTVLQAEATIASQTLILETIVAETREDFSRRNQLRVQRKQIQETEESAHRRRRSLEDQQHQVEFTLQQLQHQLTATADRMVEEFHVPLSELVSGGASAYKIYLTEQYGEEVAAEITRQHSSESEEGLDAEDDSLSEDEEVQSSLEIEDELQEENEESDAEEPEETDEFVMPDSIPTYEEVRDELESRVDRLRRKAKMMGHVNPDALESLESLETRYQTLSHQLKDLQQAKSVLEEIIRKINKESQRIFLETFENIRVHFQELFRKLFGGGDADIILEDPDDVLECGIDIVARPPGKELRSITLLSGGEKTMTAVGLLFAMFKSKPSPYCILDEVDAALDDANVDRYVNVVKEFVATTQFVIITHRKRTMTAADILYGVTMEQAGISKRISVNFEDVDDNGEINVAA
ncbi:chromosome segregation protein SMC [Thalassoglobus sp. JC818]|uniref:chromosome segregation protein SMC n=1 Tax=Thalassoglobus sp. JC818 TaxID=3232136 RepID=UPI003457C6CC